MIFSVKREKNIQYSIESHEILAPLRMIVPSMGYAAGCYERLENNCHLSSLPCFRFFYFSNFSFLQYFLLFYSFHPFFFPILLLSPVLSFFYLTYCPFSFLFFRVNISLAFLSVLLSCIFPLILRFPLFPYFCTFSPLFPNFLPILRSSNFDFPSLFVLPAAGLCEEQRHVIDLVLRGKSVFFTGAAGTGKSFLLKKLHQVL